MRRLFMILVLFELLLTNCNQKKCFREAMSPPKVKGIPDEAFWRGGVDGGNWFVIDSVNKEKNIAYFRIYNDNSGDLLENKMFKLDCNANEQVKWDNFKEQIQMFDGEKILLHIIQKGKVSQEKDISHCYFQ
ncbi:MAG: hypothetical protein QM737_18685 [Ferruginibacter sp.]